VRRISFARSVRALPAPKGARTGQFRRVGQFCIGTALRRITSSYHRAEGVGPRERTVVHRDRPIERLVELMLRMLAPASSIDRRR
jgi:hypothetical protein